MENIMENLGNVLLILGAVYPPLMYLLPVKYASRIDLGIKVIKSVAEALDRAKNTKAGLTNKEDETISTLNNENKTFVQKSKS
ncbi:hypothetical protein [Arcobacter aquimarinus]|uniref:Uncharacterized protein n=1 Tax=Arcobacter aquimarinus TaxID=1315211 RepID=A0AAE7B2G9_9BACT|nr:hypothetical protein [Arcobacter aquimarinus]QKE26054.1 hypothetical protein AAQM_1305 [Arcobacter aquimarinus]